MSDEALHQRGESSTTECCPRPVAGSSRALRRRAPVVTRVRPVGAASISLPARGFPAESNSSDSRNHSAGHVETPSRHGGTAAKVREKRRPDHRGGCHRRVECLSAYAKKAWISRVPKAATFKSTFRIPLIACSSRSSRRLTTFWPCRERPVGVRVKEFDNEDGGNHARVSSEQQREENTIASQTAALIAFAKTHDLEVPQEWVLEDEGYSGATLERPGLERVRDLLRRGRSRWCLRIRLTA